MAEREATGSFDAFDPSTWRFEPAPAPWYRRGQARTALIAVAAAAAAIVVSGVLLLVDGSGAVHEEPAPAPASTAPSTAASTPAPTSVVPPPPPAAPPPPPPPAEVSAQPIAPAPAQTAEESPTREMKKPEFGVTRTQETRRPISVAPRRPG